MFVEYVREGATVVSLMLISVIALQYSMNFALLFIAAKGLFQCRQRTMMKDEDPNSQWCANRGDTPPISIIVPAYNEVNIIEESIKSSLQLIYPVFEVIVINDGSTDETLNRLLTTFEMRACDQAIENALPHQPIRRIYQSRRYPNLIVVDKSNGGKADTLNAGINIAKYPLICTLDADSILQPDSLLSMVKPFLADPDRTIAVGGMVRVINGCTLKAGRLLNIELPKSWLVRFQVIEYLRNFFIGRFPWSNINAVLLISGAYGIFKRKIMVDVGGYRKDLLGEDLELVVRLHRHNRNRNNNYQIAFVPESICWTQCPTDFRSLANQRIRWQRGALETFFRHKDMLFNLRYGRIGIIGFGYFLLVDIIGPVVETLGYILLLVFYSLNAFSTEYVLAILAAVFVHNVLVSIMALVFMQYTKNRFEIIQLIKLVGISAVENFGYRQMCNLFRIVGWWRHFANKNTQWGYIKRVDH